MDTEVHNLGKRRFGWSKYNDQNETVEIKSTNVTADVIEWTDYSGKENDVVWKHPTNSIKWGTALIVQEYEVAVFFRDGKLYDVFGPGRHALTTPNMPLLTKAFNTIYQQPLFNSTVYYVAIKEFDGFFGGRTQTKELFPLLANGQFWYKISDATLFVNEVVGGNKKYSPEEISKFVKSFMTENLMKELAAYSLENVFTEGLDTTSLKIKNAVSDKFKRFGLDLFDLKFNTLDTEERYRELAVMVKQGVSATEVLRMYTLRESAESIGKSNGGAATGAGLILPMGMQGFMNSPSPPNDEKPQKKSSDKALEKLRMRLVDGEISEEEFMRKKKLLE